MTFHPGRARKAEKNAHSSDPSIDRQYWAYVAADQLTDALDEIERLRAIIDKPLEEKAWKMDCDILNASSDDAEVYLARRWHAAYRKAQNSNLIRAQEIERLRAKVGKMEFLMRSAEDTCLACAIKLEVIDQQAARIQELEAQLALTTSALENATRKPDVIDATGTGNLDFSDTNVVDDLIKNGNGLRARAHKAEARIKELEDALVEERARLYSLENTGTQLSQAGDQFQKRCRRSARNQLQAEGKIGPDAKQHDHTAEFFRANESPANAKKLLKNEHEEVDW